MVPDESNVLNEEIITALVKLKETKEKRWSIIKQKFFEKYEQCVDEDEEDGHEKYLAVEETLPPERVNKVASNKKDRGAWVEQEFIAPELKPYHDEAERLRYDIEDKIKILTLMVKPNNSPENLPIETDQQDSIQIKQEPNLTDTEASSSSVMAPKNRVKTKAKNPPARLQKCKGSGSSSSNVNHDEEEWETLNEENSDIKTSLLDESSNFNKKVNKRNVQDDELAEALRKLQENKMRRWSLIKKKFYEKYENVEGTCPESLQNGHRAYESLGQEANLVYVSEDLAEHHVEANKLRNFIEEKVLSSKPYQAKLRRKKKTQQIKECSEETMEKIVQTTLQFRKKCSLNGDLIVQNRDIKSLPSRALKHPSVHENVANTSKRPGGVTEEICTLAFSDKSASASFFEPNSSMSVKAKNSPKRKSLSKLTPGKKRRSLKLLEKKNSSTQKNVANTSKRSGGKKPEVCTLALSDRSASSSFYEPNASASVQAQNSPRKKSLSKLAPRKKKSAMKALTPLSVQSVTTALKSPNSKMSEEQSSAASSDKSDSTGDFVSESSASAEHQSSQKRKRQSRVHPKNNQTVQKFQKRQSMKNSKSTSINSEEMNELDSESVIDECSPKEDLRSFSSASNQVQNTSVDQLPFKHLSLKHHTVQSQETWQPDLDRFAVSCSSEGEKESGLEFHNRSKHQSFRISPKVKELRHSQLSTSSFYDDNDVESESVEMSTSDPPSDLHSTSSKSRSKLSSSALKKRKYKISEDHSTSGSAEMSASNHLSCYTPVGSGCLSTPKKQKLKDSRRNSLPHEGTVRVSKPSHNSSLQNPKQGRSADVNFVRKVNTLVSPGPSSSPGNSRPLSNKSNCSPKLFDTSGIPEDELTIPNNPS